ncbi:MAG: class I poly(R)-hydroxyalkanoic acid synthase [Betaproteobacteria bacterium]|nr:class I poly(R)-hydroxyalkanoic acid synthase [Betaproteobacteria bacterium]
MPNPPTDPTQFLATLFQAGQDMLRPTIAPGADADSAANSNSAAPAADLDPFAALAATAKTLAEMQQEYIRQMAGMWLALPGLAAMVPGAAPASTDKRFAGAAWQADPRFDLLTNGYLSYAKFLQGSVEAATVDDKAKDQLRFAVRQYIDAMSPANFLASNPEAIQLALETGGQSLVEGMGLFFKDAAKGRVSMTDETAFEVGVNVGVTPGSVVFENELIQVIQYDAQSATVHERPLVIIPPCINKYYILDLKPSNSFVRHAVEQGHTVFMASWRNITPDLGALTWDDYLQDGVMRAIDVALDITGADQVNALGFCIGGTLLASALAVMRTNNVGKVASATLLTTMLDFADPGEIGALLSDDSVAQREKAIGGGGVLEGKDLALAFSSLRANDLIWPYVVNSYLKGKAPPAFDLLYWNSDGTNLPGPMFCWYLRNMYLENNLREPGKTLQCGVPVDLAEVDMPAFVYASKEDHIVPWKSAYASTGLLGGDVTFVLGASGHIAGVVNPPSKNKRNYWAGGTLGGDPARWLDTAQSVPGSWWPVWSAWLATHAGSRVAAPKAPGNRKYKRIEPAPGRYVVAKAA